MKVEWLGHACFFLTGEALKPRIIIPMHFRTEVVSLPIAPLDDFLEGKEGVRREKILDLGKGDLAGETEIVVLDYPRG